MKLGRRRFIGAAGAFGASALAMHVSPLIRTLRAEDGVPPKRLFIFFSPLGAVRDAWVPTGTETDFRFGEILAPLEHLKSELVICDGIAQQREIYSSANHQEMGGILTGKRVAGDNETSSHTHISVDQFIANDDAVTGGTAFRSLALAAWQKRYYAFLPQIDHMYMSALGAGRAVVPEGLPQAAFDRVFGGFTTPSPDETAEPDPRLARRRSILDAAARELESVRPRLSARERDKIDQHLTSVRELELRLMDTPFTGGAGAAAACSVPGRPGEFEIDDDATLETRLRLQYDIAIASLACDRTRIVAVTGEGGRSDSAHPWLGISDRFHEITHSPHHVEHTAICRWYAEQFAYVLDRLRSIPEGSGTLLDNTVVAWVTEQGCRPASDEHSRVNMPWILAGRAGGALRTGRFLRLSGYQSNSFLITLMNLMGIAGDTFGDVTAPPLPL